MYYDNTFHSYDELKMAIENYIMYYNTKRIKEKLNWLSPVDYRLATTAEKKFRATSLGYSEIKV